MEQYAKHLILFGNGSNAFQYTKLENGEYVRNYVATVSDIGNNIVIEEDMLKTYNEATLEVPAIRNSYLNTLDLKKYDVFKIYFKYFNNKTEADAATIDDLDLIFHGYINSLPTREDKSSGLIYSDLGLRSTSGLFYETTSLVKYFDSNLQFILETARDYSNLFNIDFDIDSNIKSNWIFKVGTSNYIGEVFDNLRKDYAINIFQKPDGVMNISLPSSFYPKEESFIMDLKTNVFEIDYGDVTQNVDTIIVLGTNCVGIAFDPIAYQLKRGVLPKDLVNSINPDKSTLNPLMIFRRDLYSEEDCQRVAREKLLSLCKNYVITLKCKFEPSVQLGSQFIVINSNKLSPNQVWIVKHRHIEINKTGGAIMTIKGYSNSISEFPEDLVLDSSGIYDTDILELGSRIESVTTLHTG